MHFTSIRTRKEKVLTLVAVIFCAFFWGLLALSVFSPFLSWMDSNEGLAQVFVLLVPVFVVFFYIGLFLLFVYLANALAMAMIRINGVRLGKRQFPAFYDLFEKAAATLGIKKLPGAYVINFDGGLNAFAIKIAGRRMVVFSSELVEALTDAGKTEELAAVAAHELTHVKLKHVNYWILLMPFFFLPFLGKMLSRARETSSDRGALFVVRNEGIVSQALVKLVTGKALGKEVNIDEYVRQIEIEYGFFVWLAHILSTHPPIPYRIQALREFEHKNPHRAVL